MDMSAFGEGLPRQGKNMPKRPSATSRKSSQRIVPVDRINRSPSIRKEKQPDKREMIPEDLENKAHDAIPDIQTPPPIPEELPRSDSQYREVPLAESTEDERLSLSPSDEEDESMQREIELEQQRMEYGARLMSRITANRQREDREAAQPWLEREFPVIGRIKKWMHTPLFGKGARERERIESERPMSDMARRLMEASRDTSKELSRKAERLGLRNYLNRASELINTYTTPRQRQVAGMSLLVCGLMTPALAPVLIVPGFFLRLAGSTLLSKTGADWLDRKLEGRGYEAAAREKYASIYGGAVFVALMVGGTIASEYFAGKPDSGSASLPVSEPSSIAVAPEVPAPVPAESSFIHAVSNESAGGIDMPASEPTVQPEVTDPALEVPQIPEPPAPIEISGDMSVWGSFTDSLAERGFDLNGREDSLALAIQQAVEETGTQGEFLERGGKALSDVAWNKIPDGTMVHFDKLFENAAFKERLAELLESKQFKSLGGEVVKLGGTIEFLDKLAASYGAR